MLGLRSLCRYQSLVMSLRLRTQALEFRFNDRQVACVTQKEDSTLGYGMPKRYRRVNKVETRK
jgi:hypothetical protein